MAKSSKSSKSARSERQRLIDETLKKQRSSEKRRGNAIVGVAIAIAIVLIGITGYPMVSGFFRKDAYAGEDLAQIGAAASVCGEITEKPGAGVSNHVDEGTPVTYEDAPPAFGPHWNAVGAPAAFDRKFYTENDRPELEQLVHNLEHGYTILWYDDTIADDNAAIAQIRAIASKFDTDQAGNENFRNKFIAAPWLSSDEDGATFPDGQHVAFTHWKRADGTEQLPDNSGQTVDSLGVFQYCSDVSGEALSSFMADYPYTDSPEASAI